MISAGALEDIIDRSELDISKALKNLEIMTSELKNLPEPIAPGEYRCHVIDKNEVEKYFLRQKAKHSLS